MTTWGEAIRAGTADLAAAGVPDPARDARVLARWAGALDGAGLASVLDQPVGAFLPQYRQAVQARAERQPVAQITGTRLFWGRPFQVTPAVLDPRPETECLVAAALAQPAQRILDLGTGSGCLLITLLAEWPEATGLGTDISADALAVAKANGAALGVGPRAAFHVADWLADLRGQFDLIVSNPPYLSADELARAAPELGHEPALALSPGGDGLAAYRVFAAEIGAHMADGGRLLVEIGATQAPTVLEIFDQAGLTDFEIIPDLDQRPRVISARLSR